MADLVFYDHITCEPLPFEEDGEYYTCLQYEGWFVRSLTRMGEGKVGLWFDNAFLELEWDESTQGYVLPQRTKKQKECRGKIEGTVGLLTLATSIGIDATEDLKPSLFTLPASLSSEEYRALLDQIREVAITTRSASQIPLLISQEKRDRAESPVESLNHQSEILIKLSDTLRKQWNMISTYPSRELRRGSALMPIGHPIAQVTPSGVIQQAIRPDRTHISLQVVKEDYDTVENRFVYMVLSNLILRQGKALLARLQRRSSILEMQASHSFNPKGLPRMRWTAYQKRYVQQQQRFREQAKHYNRLAQKLKDAMRWANNALQAKWFEQVSKQDFRPNQISQRLLRSVDYAPIYQAYLEVIQVTDVDIAGQVLELLDRYEERPIRSMDQLYELWLFFEIYQTLIDDFGFQPKGIQPTEALKWERGCLELPKQGFQLVLQIDEQGKQVEVCQAELRYDLKLSAPDCNSDKRCFDKRICPSLGCYQKVTSGAWKNSLRPDVLLIIKYEDQEFYYAIDAKYRSYDKQCVSPSDLALYGVDNTFDHDVLGVAKMKYFDTLNLTAAFIVHTDKREEYTFWGQEPFRSMPARQAPAIENRGLRFSLLKTGIQIGNDDGAWPAHRFGAVCATPLQPGNLYKLLRCILMYHTRIVNICWHCRKRLTAYNDGAHIDSGNGVGSISPDEEQQQIQNIEKGKTRGAVYYQCNCGNFWILQRCFGERHPLIKLGIDSFHARSRIQPEAEWVNLCPACGSDLPKRTADF